MSNLVVISHRPNTDVYGRRCEIKVSLDTESQVLTIALLDKQSGQVFALKRIGDIAEGQPSPACEVKIPPKMEPELYQVFLRFVLQLHTYNRMESSKLLGDDLSGHDESDEPEITLASLGY